MAAPVERHEFDLCPELCEDFIGFQEKLKRTRTVDDRVINVLNTTVPLKSFDQNMDHSKKCEDFYHQMNKSYDERDKAIKYCVTKVSESVQKLREQRRAAPDDFDVLKALRGEQTKLRLLQSEISVEEIIRDRTFKAFYERCREHYRPPNMPKV